MNWLLVLFGFGLLCLSLGEQYTDRYDNVNIDEILANKRLLIPYVKCMLGQGRCTPEGKALKNHVNDAMTTGCEKCTDWQRKSARKVIKHIKEHEQQHWEQLKTKYDPGDKYKPTYEQFLAHED